MLAMSSMAISKGYVPFFLSLVTSPQYYPKQFNVLIDDGGKAILCDFGIAQIKDDIASTSMGTVHHSIAGTPSFMPPERLKGGSLRKPCDVYAFGMLIYEARIARLLTL
jgi:serine/threonine protein kinase